MNGRAENPELKAEAALLKEKVNRILENLSKKERAAFILRYDRGLDLKEIAEVLGLSLGTVKNYLFRSVRKIQKEITYD